MTAQLVCDALTMALWRRRMPTGVIVHSDRGSQYCSGAYQALLDEHGLICSMSGKGNCYDNACAESFFHSLKVEAIHGERFNTRQAMRQAVFEYIEVDYNLTRRHSAAIPARQRLRQNKSLKDVSTIGGQDQYACKQRYAPPIWKEGE